MSDWRRETAADVGWGNWEAQEARDAERAGGFTSCQPGKHRMISDRHGGGVCVNCGDTVSAGEL